MNEQAKPITNYEGLYEITESGRIFSIKRKKYLSRCNDEYGFHIVKLYRNGIGKNHKVYELWQNEFGADLPENLFKGVLSKKYK
jgi:hypothetical protein